MKRFSRIRYCAGIFYEYASWQLGKLNDRRLLFILIYLAAFGIVYQYIIAHPYVMSDQSLEYAVYLENIDLGHWHYIAESLVNSSLISTLLPALIQRQFNTDVLLTYQIIPAFFFPLMPAFVYLISRKSMDVRQSLISSCLVLASFYFMYNPGIGRVGVALGLAAGAVWALMGKRYIYGSVFGALTVFAHYGTVFILCGLCALVFLYELWKVRYDIDHEVLSKVFMIMLVVITGTLFWHFLIFQYSGGVGKTFVERSLTMSERIVPKPNPAQIRTGLYIDENGTAFNASSPQSTGEVKEYTKQELFFRMDSRESVVQTAFGRTLKYMNAPQVIEWVLSWLIVLAFSWGLFISWRRKLLNQLHLLLAASSYFLIVATVVVPGFSIGYGVVRVMFTGWITLASCFVAGMGQITKYKYLPAALVVVLYALCTSGVLHSWYGIVK